jgi:hypothetical protein
MKVGKCCFIQNVITGACLSLEVATCGCLNPTHPWKSGVLVGEDGPLFKHLLAWDPDLSTCTKCEMINIQQALNNCWMERAIIVIGPLEPSLLQLRHRGMRRSGLEIWNRLFSSFQFRAPPQVVPPSYELEKKVFWCNQETVLTEGVDDLLLEKASHFQYSALVIKDFPEFQPKTLLPSLPPWHGEHSSAPSGPGWEKATHPHPPTDLQAPLNEVS